MAQKTLRRVAVLGGVRTPFCRSNTLYSELTNLDLMIAAVQSLADRFKLAGEHIDEVIGGAVVTHSKDWNIAREAVIGTTLKPTTPGVTIMQACGTSLQAAAMIAGKIATGETECGIAMGSDTVSDPPIVFRRQAAQKFAQLGRARSTAEKLKVLQTMRPADLAPQPPSVSEPRTGLSMGEHCELMAQEWNIPRVEQDVLAYESHTKAAKAYRDGFMDDLVVPTAGVFQDNNIRSDTTVEKLSTLKTAYEKSERGTLTAGNSTPLTDGGAAVLLASEDWAAKRGLKPQAYLVHTQHVALDFVNGEGLLMAPTLAVSRMLDRAGLKLQDFDLYEIHEAFAAQVLATLRAWESADYCKRALGRDEPLGSIDRLKMNVRGSSLAVGHPFAATGARILATLAKQLAERGKGRGLISVCTAGGMGVAAILEAA
jgi:acetyl-CoA C-acetyltransferase